jgi:hypothetical protein
LILLASLWAAGVGFRDREIHGFAARSRVPMSRRGREMWKVSIFAIIPQGAKAPVSFQTLCGTTEVVPFPKLF